MRCVRFYPSARALSSRPRPRSLACLWTWWEIISAFWLTTLTDKSALKANSYREFEWKLPNECSVLILRWLFLHTLPLKTVLDQHFTHKKDRTGITLTTYHTGNSPKGGSLSFSSINTRSITLPSKLVFSHTLYNFSQTSEDVDNGENWDQQFFP